MAVRDRHVDRLDDRPAGDVHGRRHVVELLQCVQIVERRVTPLAVEVAHERGAVGRRHHGMAVADRDRALGIARVVHVRRRDLADQFEQFVAAETHEIAVDLGAGPAPQLERLGILELDADLLDHAHREVVDPLDALAVGDFHQRDAAADFRMMHDRRARLRRAPRGAAALAPATGLAFGRAHSSRPTLRPS